MKSIIVLYNIKRQLQKPFVLICLTSSFFPFSFSQEWILSDEEKRLIKEKIMRNRLRRQQQEMDAQQHSSMSPNSSNSSTLSAGGKRRSLDIKLTTGSSTSAGHKTASNVAGGKRRPTASKANFLPSGKAAEYRNRSSSGGGASFGNNSSTMGNNSHLYSALNSSSPFSNIPVQTDGQTDYSGNAAGAGSSGAKFGGTAALNAFNIFQEPSAYSLDILLSDNCDAFFDPTLGGGSSNGSNNYVQQQNTELQDEWLYSATANCTTANSALATLNQAEEKIKDDFMQSLTGVGVSEMDESLNTALNDCLLFPGNMDTSSIDLFENDNDLDGLTFSGSSSGISECNESNHESPMYSNTAAAAADSMVAEIADIKKELQDLGNSSRGGTTSSHITSVTTGSNSTFEYSSVVKTESHDFTQYLLHDNDPTFTLAATGNNNNNNNSLLCNEGNASSSQQSDKVTTVSFPSLTNNNLTVQSVNDNNNSGNQHQSMALVQKSYVAPNNWDSNNGKGLMPVRYASASDAVYGNRSKVPPLVKMAPPPLPPPLSAALPTRSEANDFISNCLISNNDHSDEACNYDPVIEDVPRIGTNEVMLREIGFSNRELILPERCLIKELTEACSVLKNPYKRILVFNNYDSVRSCRITEYSFHRLIRCAKRLSRFSMLPLGDQAKMLKYSLLEMLAMRSVLSYNPDRESWGFIDVSLTFQNKKQFQYKKIFI